VIEPWDETVTEHLARKKREAHLDGCAQVPKEQVVMWRRLWCDAIRDRAGAREQVALRVARSYLREVGLDGLRVLRFASNFETIQVQTWALAKPKGGAS
jgi:hypothetical protein